MKRINKFRLTVALLMNLLAVACLTQFTFASSYTWTHQEYQNVMVQQGYWTTETYISGYHTETRQVGTGYKDETYVVSPGYWTTESYISGYVTETYQSGSHSEWRLISPGHYTYSSPNSTGQVIGNFGYGWIYNCGGAGQPIPAGYEPLGAYSYNQWLVINPSTGAVLGNMLGSGWTYYAGGAGQPIPDGYVPLGAYSFNQWLVINPSTGVVLGNMAGSGWTYYAGGSGQPIPAGYVPLGAYSFNQWLVIDPSTGTVLGNFASGGWRYFNGSSGPPVPAGYVALGAYSSTQWLVINFNSPKWVPDQYGWVSVPDYATRAVPVWATRNVWVAPVYATRTVSYPIYQDFQVADYAARNVYVPPVFQWQWVTVNSVISTPNISFDISPAGTPKDTDSLAFNVSVFDPQSYPINAIRWTIQSPNGSTVTQSSTPTRFSWPGIWKVTAQAQSRLPDGQLSPWSDPYTQNITVIPEQIAQIVSVKLTNIVKPPLWVQLPIDMPTKAPIQIKSGYNVTMHVVSKGNGSFKVELFSAGAAIPIGQNTTNEAAFLTAVIPDGGGDLTFFVPTSVANGSTIDVKFTEQVTDGAGYQTSSVFSMPTSFVINGSALDDTVVNRTK